MDTVSSQVLRAICFAFICQGLSTMVSGECPADAENRIQMCTKHLNQFGNNNNNNNKEALTKYCRTLKEAPACLQQILHQCQGDTGLGSIEVLKNVTNQLKAAFDKKCEQICGQCFYDIPTPDAKAISSSSMVWHHLTLILGGVLSTRMLAS
ncbi:uncharacterized protein LOC124136055 isoform X1 [Haliotis rufescens]|uniref:uncharacterized protein LOC124136055 isoform X1 n=1 Tax=Haliotis rufescens TaxID=6454 RepID=UPI00201FA1C4|nr:uncharacterized protein LOC124136055 isoform X1 [Haliotis rufescens]